MSEHPPKVIEKCTAVWVLSWLGVYAEKADQIEMKPKKGEQQYRKNTYVE